MPTKPDDPRIATVGTGNVADLNVAGYLEDPRGQVVALWDTVEARAVQAAEEWDEPTEPTVSTDLEAVLADPGIDAAEVLTSSHSVDALVEGVRPEMSATEATKALQLCFAVHQANNTREPVDPRTVDGTVSPDGWPL